MSNGDKPASGVPPTGSTGPAATSETTAGAFSSSDAAAMAAAKDRKRRRARKRHSEDEGLNIYSMLDLMTIILVFLLKNWQSDEIPLAPGVRPPVSTITEKPTASVRIFLDKDKILLDDKPVAGIENGDVAKADLDPDNGYLIQALSDGLREKAEQFLKIEAAGGVRFEGRYAVIADRDVPWLLLKKIIFTAGQTSAPDQDGLERSFGDLRLITKKSGT